MQRKLNLTKKCKLYFNTSKDYIENDMSIMEVSAQSLNWFHFQWQYMFGRCIYYLFDLPRLLLLLFLIKEWIYLNH